MHLSTEMVKSAASHNGHSCVGGISLTWLAHSSQVGLCWAKVSFQRSYTSAILQENSCPCIECVCAKKYRDTVWFYSPLLKV